VLVAEQAKNFQKTLERSKARSPSTTWRPNYSQLTKFEATVGRGELQALGALFAEKRNLEPDVDVGEPAGFELRDVYNTYLPKLREKRRIRGYWCQQPAPVLGRAHRR